jgi:farnesyl-diphosphate farnesyltransferase
VTALQPVNNKNISSAARYQECILPRVSRTFALTIPQLPSRLSEAVANAYLLCRIADTIEDDPALTADQQEHFQRVFAGLVVGEGSIEDFVAGLTPLLSSQSSPDEHDLIRNAGEVLRVTASLSIAQRRAIARCLRIMCGGMHRFQRSAGPGGLRDLAELDRYCYFVAGVVGEMLTGLFCAHSPAIAQRREAMMNLSVSFGQGLQMTNILKDVWEDRARGACWLPRETFAAHGYDLAQLAPGRREESFKAAYRELIGVAHAHLRDALAYTLLIPAHETGIRRFCAWAIGMAVLTLDRINRNLEFSSGAQVKISRRAVGWTMLLTRVGARSDRWLTWLFDLAARDLPRGRRADGWSAFVPSCSTELDRADVR